MVGGPLSVVAKTGVAPDLEYAIERLQAKASAEGEKVH